MDQVIIRVEKTDKDIRDCTEPMRKEFYNSQSKGQLMSLLEKYVKDTKGQM